jgi:hypothetical protein
MSLIFNAIYLTNSVEKKENNSGQSIIKQFGFGLLLVFIIVVVSNSWFSIPQAVLKTYGLADVENVRLAVGKDDCKSIKQLGIQHIIKKDDICVINNATIISAVGADYYIKSTDNKRFALPQSSVKISRMPIAPLQIKVNEVVDKENNVAQINYTVSNEQRIAVRNISLTFYVFDQEGNSLGAKGPVILGDILPYTNTEVSSVISDGKYEKDETKTTATKVAWFDVELKIDGKEYWVRIETLENPN